MAFFNASTRLTGLSLNAAFAYLTACSLQLSGVPVVYFGCKSGISRCVLGTDRDDYRNPPPCKSCIAQAEHLFGHAPTVWFSFSKDEGLAQQLKDLDIERLSAFEYRFPSNGHGMDSLSMPLGRLTLPSLRWALRRQNLQDDEATRFLFRQYILSA
ncbi:MAG: hypothetical protein P8Y03_27840, partial [Anaerolineales bacterium]